MRNREIRSSASLPRATSTRKASPSHAPARCSRGLLTEAAGPLGSAADEVQKPRADHPEGGETHRRHRPVEALGEADAEVDAGVVGRERRAAHRDRVQRRDGPGLREPDPGVIAYFGVHVAVAAAIVLSGFWILLRSRPKPSEVGAR